MGVEGHPWKKQELLERAGIQAVSGEKEEGRGCFLVSLPHGAVSIREQEAPGFMMGLSAWNPAAD